jgi:hypothetical protein
MRQWFAVLLAGSAFAICPAFGHAESASAKIKLRHCADVGAVAYKITQLRDAGGNPDIARSIIRRDFAHDRASRYAALDMVESIYRVQVDANPTEISHFYIHGCLRDAGIE